MDDRVLLTMDDVRFRHPRAGHDTIDIARLRLAPAQRLLVRGASGCGKSTLLSLAAGVLLADAGYVGLAGREWRALGAGRRDGYRVDHVGYIFQQFNLLPYLSVLDNVLLPCRFSSLRSRRASDTDGNVTGAAHRLLDALGLSAALRRRPAGDLSVGQQQRVAAARALIGSPDLVIADEPTSALDENRRDEFMRLLIAQCDAGRSALLFVSHDARLACHFDAVIDLASINRASPAAP